MLTLYANKCSRWGMKAIKIVLYKSMEILFCNILGRMDILCQKRLLR